MITILTMKRDVCWLWFCDCELGEPIDTLIMHGWIGFILLDYMW